MSLFSESQREFIKSGAPEITLGRSEYIELVSASARLLALDDAGVDNWEWYTESLQDYWEEAEEVGVE